MGLRRAVGGEDGQVLVFGALLLVLLFIFLLGFIGAAEALLVLNGSQSSADAAALAGAQQVNWQQTTLGQDPSTGQPYLLCEVGQIDPVRAQQAADNYWQTNASAWPATTLSTNVQVSSAGAVVTFTAVVSFHSGLFGIVGHPTVTWTVTSMAHVGRSRCQDPILGPVFEATPVGGAPWGSTPGWPDPNAQWVWNFPMSATNAPAEWPVYFVRVFAVPQQESVTLYVQADNQFTGYLDNQQVLSGQAWNVVDSSSAINLAPGAHVLIIEVQNDASQVVPQPGANPAGLLAALYGPGNQLLFDTQGNPASQAGQPPWAPQGNCPTNGIPSPNPGCNAWSSYSPPNPDWAVYTDPFYPTSWLGNGGTLADYLQWAGFQIEDANSFGSWLGQQAGNGQAPASIAVFAQDVAPDTAVPTESAGTPLGQYLAGGGSVLWVGDVPFYYQGHSGGSSTAWGIGGTQAVLGVPDPSQWGGGGWSPNPTPAGAAYGIGNTTWLWQSSQRALTPNGNCTVQDLATAADGSGSFSYWRLPHWPNPLPASLCSGPFNWQPYIQAAWRYDSPGFVRVYATSISAGDPYVESSILQLAGQMGGWYTGQTP